VYLYASRGQLRVTQITRISIMAERIEILLGLIDRASLNYMKKVSLFLHCVIYKRRYHEKIEIRKFSFVRSFINLYKLIKN